MATEKQAEHVRDWLIKKLVKESFWSVISVIADKYEKGSHIVAVYLKRRKISKGLLPSQIDGVKVVPMYLGNVELQPHQVASRIGMD